MKLILALLAALILAGASDYYRVRFQDGYAYTAVPTALYSEPCHPSEIMISIPPGKFLDVHGFAGVILEHDSYKFGWYEVSWYTDSCTYSGFVFEPNLALAQVHLEGDSLAVYTTTGLHGDAVTGMVSVVFGGGELASLEVEPDWLQSLINFDVHMIELDHRGLEGVRHLFSLYSGSTTIAGSERQYLVAYTDDGRLIEGPQVPGPAPGGPTNYWTRIILPADEGGEDGRVIVNYLGEAYDSESDSWDRIIDEYETYDWTGEDFVLSE